MLLNLALAVVVLVPTYAIVAPVLDLALGVGTGSLPERIVHHVRDRWWVPLIYLLCAPFVMLLLRWLARARPAVSLRRVALLAAPLAYAALFLFFFAASAPTSVALVRALLPGMLAVLVYASVLRLPVSRARDRSPDARGDR